MNTKEKIQEAATVLFSKYGYDGTSVRDIANEAGVNVAAINYHFKNKEKLYIEVFEKNCEWLETGLNEIRQSGVEDVEDFVWAMFQFMLNNGNCIVNAFKMLMTDSVQIPKETLMQDDFMGPPGGKLVLELITKEVGEDVPFEGRMWAMNCIFDVCAHLALFMSTSFGKVKAADIPSLKPKSLELTIRSQAAAVLEYLKNHPEKWENI